MKNPYHIKRLGLCLGVLLFINIKGATLFADDTNATPPWPKEAAGGSALAQQAQDTLEQAQSPKDYEDAAGLFERAVAAEPNNDDLRLTLAWLYLDKLHEPQPAYRNVKIVVADRPNDVNARKLMGMAATQTGRPTQAVRQFKHAAQLQPDDLWIQANLGRALARDGHWITANAIYNNVLAKDPNNADARLGKAELAAWRGESGKALAILSQLLAENPSNEEALLLQADIYRWQWSLSKSIATDQQVLDMDTNSAPARQGIAQAHQMAASDVAGSLYYFKDTSEFTREYVGADGRLFIANQVYLTGGASGWRFQSPGFDNIDRIDGRAGLEIHWARWLSTSVEGDFFDYQHDRIYGGQENEFGGGQLSVTLTPFTKLNIYTVISGNQPFISSISTVTNALKQHAIGNGVDLKLWGPLSVQNSIQVAKISDNNLWVEEKPQVSLKVLSIPATYVRVEYDYLDYRHANALYWTPQHWSILWPTLDTSIPIFKGLHIDVTAQAPYVFNEHGWGYQVQAGPSLMLFNHIKINASYYRSKIPGDQGEWSGQGGQGTLTVLF
jgi:tetratricopeptide (TPR) repeat protein